MRRGRVNETEAAADELMEEDPVAKGGGNRGLGKSLGGIRNPKIGSKERDEALDHDLLGPKTMK